MIQQSLINHKTRLTTSLSVLACLVADIYYKNPGEATQKAIAEFLGISTIGVRKAKDELEAGGYIMDEDVTQLYVDTFILLTNKKIPDNEIDKVTVSAISLMNELLTQQDIAMSYKPTNGIKKLIKPILLQHKPNFIMRVIGYKANEWLKDPTMQKYFRPTTLFRSANRFRDYSLEAEAYYAGKHDQNRNGNTVSDNKHAQLGN